MRSPNTGSPMRLVEGEAATYTLRGEQFHVSGPAWECPDTGERYLDPAHLDEVFTRLHRAWRERHGIGKEALRQRRKSLDIPATQASALLGFGINQYRTYENTDKLPSKSNAVLLKLLFDDQALPGLIRAAGPMLTNTTRRKLQAWLAAPATHLIDVTSPISWAGDFASLSADSFRHFAAPQATGSTEPSKSAQRTRALDIHPAYA